MKKTFNSIKQLVVLLLLVSAGCEKESRNDVETSITTVKLLSPLDQTTVNLNPYLNAVVNFEWEAAKTGNYTMAYYKVQFDAENGDFSKPVYTAVSSGNGSETRLSLPHKELVKAAETIGIKELQSGKIRWRVLSGNGVASSVSASGTLLLHRLAVQTAMRTDFFTHDLTIDAI
jgi:hypothetical protein